MRNQNPILRDFETNFQGSKTPIKASWLNTVARFVSTFTVTGAGSFFFDGKNARLHIRGPVCPFKIRRISSETPNHIAVNYATLVGDTYTGTGHTTFNGVPNIGGTDIGSSEEPTLALTAGETNWILLKVTTSPDQLIKDAEIVAALASTLPANVPADYVGDTDGTYYLELGRADVDDDGNASNIRSAFCGSIAFEPCGDGNVRWRPLGNFNQYAST